MKSFTNLLMILYLFAGDPFSMFEELNILVDVNGNIPPLDAFGECLSQDINVIYQIVTMIVNNPLLDCRQPSTGLLTTLYWIVDNPLLDCRQPSTGLLTTLYWIVNNHLPDCCHSSTGLLIKLCPIHVPDIFPLLISFTRSLIKNSCEQKIGKKC